MITRTMLVVLVVVIICIWIFGWCSIAVADAETVITVQGVGDPWGINGSNAPLPDQISSTLPIFGGNGGNVEIFTGVVVDLGDGRDGDLTQSAKLEPGEYFYRHVAMTEFDLWNIDPLDFFENLIIRITVRGHVIIHCQYMFEAIICADYSYGPPILEVYAGYPSPPVRIYGNDFGHQVFLDMSAPDSELPIDGGCFIFHTNAIGGIYSLFRVEGGNGYNGGNGGNGGSISLYTNDGRIYAQNYLSGGAGGDAVELGGDGGTGGNGGVISVKTVCINTEPNDCDVSASFASSGGNGGNGAVAATAEAGTSGKPGGHGGHGGNAGSAMIEADKIIAVGGSLFGGSGGRADRGSDGGRGGLGEYGTGGRGGDGGAGGRGGELWIEGISVTMDESDISGGDGGPGAFGGDGGVLEESQHDNPDIIAATGGAGGSGGDGGPAGHIKCVAEDLIFRKGPGKSVRGLWLAEGGKGGSSHLGGGGKGAGDDYIQTVSIINKFSSGRGGCGGLGGNGGDGGPGGDWEISCRNLDFVVHRGDYLISSNGGDGGDGGRGGYGGGGMRGGYGGDGGDGGTAGSAGNLPVLNISLDGLSTECENGRHGNGGTGGFGGRAPEEGRELNSPGGVGGNGGFGGDGYSGGDGGGGGTGNYGGNGGNGGDSWSDDDSSDAELDSQENGPTPGQGGDKGKGKPSPENDGELGESGKYQLHYYNNGSEYDRPDRQGNEGMPLFELELQADINNDGLVEAHHLEMGDGNQAREYLFVNDNVSNGCWDTEDPEAATGSTDDDTQRIRVEISGDLPESGYGIWFKHPAINCLEFYWSEECRSEEMISFPLGISEQTTIPIEMFIRSSGTEVTGQVSGNLELHYGSLEGNESYGFDSIELTIIKGLGDPDYFNAALDYIYENNTTHHVRKEYHEFPDDEVLIITMRQEDNSMTALDAFNHSPQLDTIYDVTNVYLSQTVIINGNFRMDGYNPPRHEGRLVSEGSVSPISLDSSDEPNEKLCSSSAYYIAQRFDDTFVFTQGEVPVERDVSGQIVRAGDNIKEAMGGLNHAFDHSDNQRYSYSIVGVGNGYNGREDEGVVVIVQEKPGGLLDYTNSQPIVRYQLHLSGITDDKIAMNDGSASTALAIQGPDGNITIRHIGGRHTVLGYPDDRIFTYILFQTLKPR